MEIFIVIVFRGQKIDIEAFKDEKTAQKYFDLKNKSYTCEIRVKTLK